MNPKMRGEKARVVFLSVRVHMRLKEGDGVGVIGLLYRPKEDAAAGAIGVVVMHFALEPKEEEVRPGKVKNVVAVAPMGGWIGMIGSKPGT